MVSILVGLALVERASRKGYFTLHTLLTDFALALMERGEHLEASRCHAGHYLAACQRYRELEPGGWSDLDIAWENIQAAADWAAAQMNNPDIDPDVLELAVEYAVALDYVFQARKTQAAAKWFQAGVEASLKLGRKVDQGWLTLSLGTHALDQGKADEAEHFYQTSIDIFSQEGYELGVMYAQGNLGTVQRVLGKYPQALEAFRQVTEYCMQNTNPTGAALGFYNQADVKHALGQQVESRALFEQSLALLRQNAGPEEILAGALCLGASLNLELDQFDIAKTQVKEALEIAGRMRAAHLRGRALGIQGELFCRLRQRPEAEAALQESIQLLTLIGVREGLAEAHEIAARCAVQWRESDLARQHYQAAAQIFADMGAEARLQEVNTLLQAL
jgi:tetratricopeptide (TPR) repeat protein